MSMRKRLLRLKNGAKINFYKTMNILGFIPARGSKDEIKHMNIRELGGHPLIYYTIKAALKSSKINRVIVSTEDEDIKEIAVNSGADVPFLRPEYLCNDGVLMADVVSYTLEKLHSTESYTCDLVTVLYPNNPFKTSEDIDNMIGILLKNDYDSVIPLVQIRELFWRISESNIVPENFDCRQRRSDATPLYAEQGGIYVYKKEVFTKADKLRLGQKRGYYLINKHNAQTIHNMYDLFLLERLAKLPASLVNLIMEHE